MIESNEAAQKLMSRLRSLSCDDSCHSHIVDTMKFLPRCVKCLNAQSKESELVADCVALVKNIVINPEFASAVAFEPRMAHELYRIRSLTEFTKSTRHNATIALREIKTKVPTNLMQEHLQWLLEEDLEDHKTKVTPDAPQTPTSHMSIYKEKEWFVLEVPELEDPKLNLEFRIQKQCKGILSMRRGSSNDTLIITCLSSHTKDSVLKACSDVLFKARTLARCRSPSIEPAAPESPEILPTVNDSDKSPKSPPPSGATITPSKTSGTKPPKMGGTPGTPSTPLRAGQREVRGAYKNRKRDSFAGPSSMQSSKAQYLDMERMLAGDYNLTLSGHDASLAARKHRKKIIQEEKIKNETSLARRLSTYTSRSLGWLFGA